MKEGIAQMENTSSGNNEHLEIGFLKHGIPVIVKITSNNTEKDTEKVEVFSEINPAYSKSADSMLDGFYKNNVMPYFAGVTPADKGIRKACLQQQLAPKDDWPVYHMWLKESMLEHRDLYNGLDGFKRFVTDRKVELDDESTLGFLAHLGITDEDWKEYEAGVPVDFAAIAEEIQYRRKGKLLPENDNYAVGYDWTNHPVLVAKEDNGHYVPLNNICDDIWSPFALVPDKQTEHVDKLLESIFWFPTYLYTKYTSTGGLVTNGNMLLIPTPRHFYNIYFKRSSLNIDEELCKKILLACSFSEKEIQDAILYLKHSPKFIVRSLYQKDLKKRLQGIQKHMTQVDK